ncbi:bifunctional glycosyltransferase/CDP-glycerol:glycerophosphate glycerophosphotransferase [Streptomyces alboflavus]|uniref:bifunctional glycosyltransferase/CDP-glycerol:glycerophosphate glycerophosphotransferase n=1 Tax=Streptomyces alboflavus TaxID=67267 RepID=UPI0004BFEDB1|nr:bifunctional glycosyltransferase family 2 protein/CDP-glycerol:glycerophosphate glycerophosphotransferase [Streptomyces alboflavus]
MPRFSVVVPAHRVQGYLRECLESVLDQSCEDLELLVVDDASPDACAAIAAEYAQRDPRVQLVRLTRRQGTGPARDAGAARATGDWLLFLDGDDVLLPGALAAIDREITRSEEGGAEGAGGLDVLLFGHDRTDWWETVRRPAGEDVTGDPLAVTVAAWNRVFRRSFWSARGLAFSRGAYEDVVPVHRATLAAGDRVGALDRVCVRWRERRGGSFAKSPGREHFAVIGRYEELFTDGAGATDRLYLRAVDHLLAVLDDPGRIAPGDRSAYFRAAAGMLRAHRPAVRPAMTERQQALVLGSYASYRALSRAGGRMKSVRTALARRKKSVRARAMRVSYHADLRRSLDPNLAVYGAYWNRGVSCNPAAIHAKARELAPHIRGVWVVSSRHRHRVPPGVEYVIEGSRRYWRAMARATYLINNSSFPGGFTKRPGQVYLQTHHGTPLKKMGLDQRRYPAGTHGISFQKVLDHTDQWDYSLSANPHSTEVWERVYPAAYEALEAGYPRNDVYFTTGPDDIARIRADLGVRPGQRALLYAPTHRDYQKGFLPRLDLERFATALGDSWVVLVRAHYFYGADAGLADHPGLLDVTGHARVEDLCLAADALVTDYSSLMFDYACLDRPIVSYAPDWQAYRLARGTYFDLLSGRPGETPGALATTEDELTALFRDGGWDTAATTGLRKAFRERFCPYDDGGAAERVVRRVFLADQPDTGRS